MVRRSRPWTPPLEERKPPEPRFVSGIATARPIGDVLRGVRAGLRLTLPAFARVIGVSHRTLIRWEQYYTAPTHAALPGIVARIHEHDREMGRRLAAELGLSVEAPSACVDAVEDALESLALAVEVPVASLRPAMATLVEELSTAGVSLNDVATVLRQPGRLVKVDGRRGGRRRA